MERAISFRVIDQLSRRLSRNNRALLSDESVSLTALPRSIRIFSNERVFSREEIVREMLLFRDDIVF